MRRVRRKSPVDYILPFLMILGLGIILILGGQLWSNFQKQAQGDVYFYIVRGSAKVLPYGQTEWDRAFSGTKFLVGDSLKTSKSGRTVLEFFNGTLVRLGDDSAISMTDLTKQPSEETLVLNMDNGKLWLNGKKSQGVKESYYEVRTGNMHVKAKGTIFEVESNSKDIVRVFDGDVSVDVIVQNNGTERVADTINIGVGQEIILDEASLNAFADGQSPSVLQALGDEFKSSSWYRWNRSEDSSPTDFGLTKTTTDEETEILDEDEETEEDDEFAEKLGAPVITVPENSEVTHEEGELSVSGTVSEGTAEVIVETVVDGETDENKLSKFEAGDMVWDYSISDDLGNLKSGENKFYFYAVDSDGKKSDSVLLTVNYEKEEVEITEPLADPKVLTFNDSESSTVTEAVVIVKGSVAGAEKVVVNDYTLSQFEPGDTEWFYHAREDVGNLQPGENKYEVYAVDPDGKKSKTVDFTITYEKEETTVDIPGYGF